MCKHQKQPTEKRGNQTQPNTVFNLNIKTTLFEKSKISPIDNNNLTANTRQKGVNAHFLKNKMGSKVAR